MRMIVEPRDNTTLMVYCNTYYWFLRGVPLNLIQSFLLLHLSGFIQATALTLRLHYVKTYFVNRTVTNIIELLQTASFLKLSKRF